MPDALTMPPVWWSPTKGLIRPADNADEHGRWRALDGLGRVFRLVALPTDVVRLVPDGVPRALGD
jgi:hypothetical protein